MASTKSIADLRVYVSSLPGVDISGDPAERSYALVPLAIESIAGGRKLDNALFAYNLTANNERVRNLQTPVNWSQQVEVRVYTDDSTFTPIFWGDVTAQKLSVGRTETVEVTAAIYPYHFGTPCKGPRYYDPFGVAPNDYADVREELRFNPLIDGAIEDSMATATSTGGEPYHFFADPESYRTDGAEAIQNRVEKGGRERWTLAEAVHTVCWLCNENEDWILNPTKADLDTVLASAIPLRNMTLPMGKHLPFYLDHLLQPYGFDWCVELTQDDVATKRQIRVFAKSTGTQKTVKMADVGELFDFTTTNLKSFDVSTDVGSVVNAVTAVGEFKEKEFTFPLFRTWDSADDALTAEDLKKDDPDSEYNANGKRDVWRKWAACEAGDYTDFDDADGEMRATTSDIPLKDTVELDAADILRRRRIEDRLYIDDDANRLPPLLEWSDDGGTTWYEAPWTYSILSTQIGVMFNGNTPPEELVAAGDDARLRLTGTVVLDERLVGEAAMTANSPNARESFMTYEVDDRFFFRSVDDDVEAPVGSVSNDIDNTEEIEDFAEHIRDEEQSAMVRGTFTLSGINTEYEIGDLLTKVEGREISLNLNAEAAASPRYLQVTSITYRPQDQETILGTEPQQSPPYFFRRIRGGADAG